MAVLSVTSLKSPVAALKALVRHQDAYAAHNDPAAQAANIIALVLAWNGPLYPVYVLFLAGRDALPWGLLTMLVTPLFYAIPWLSRVSSLGARVALPVVGAINTVWCMKLFGVASDVGLFLYPCIVLAALLYRFPERWLRMPLLGILLALEFVPGHVFGAPIVHLSADEASRLAALNAGSVAFLLGFMVLKLVDVIRAMERGAAA
jgi:hypothetical protein